jgi:two-component system alkaline phosphatase synthesis response regulator PhoP
MKTAMLFQTKYKLFYATLKSGKSFSPRRFILSANKILVIDDDDLLLSLVQQILNRAGERVLLANDGLEGLRQFAAHKPDLIILDIMMPGMDGWETCSKIRQLSQHVPIMMLTALGDESHIVRGLSKSGADDYLVKPFSADVLIARIRALIRRATLPPISQRPANYEDDYLKVDLIEQQVWVKGQRVKLTTTEYRLLAYLVQNANKVLNFDHILQYVWGPEYCDSMDYVHVYMSRLRQKLELNPKNPQYFITQHGIGYRFQKPTLGPAKSQNSLQLDALPLLLLLLPIVPFLPT